MELHENVQLIFVFRLRLKRRYAMSKEMSATLNRRIRSGKVTKEDVARRLAELAFGKANDCVRLVLEEDTPLGKLDLSLLSEVKKNEKGTVEVKLVDRLKALEQLALLAQENGENLEEFLKALQGDEVL